MAKRGKKDCPNCKAEIAARSLICEECGFHYPSGVVRKDLLTVKQQPKKAEVYTEGGKGRKQCPKCNVFIAAVTKECPQCQHDFRAEKKEKAEKSIREVIHEVAEGASEVKREEPQRKVIDETMKILMKEEERLRNRVPVVREPQANTPEEHAKKILGYGKKRASLLLNMHKYGQTWSHVNWKMVEEGLASLPEEEPEVASPGV